MKNTLLGVSAVLLFALPATAQNPKVTSGLDVGQSVSAFHPQHVSGPHAGTDTCPPWTYGILPQVQVWTNRDSDDNMIAISKFLESRINTSSKKLTGWIVDIARSDADIANLKDIAKKAGTKKVGHTYLAPDSRYVTLYKMNLQAVVKNTVIVYKNKKVSAKFVNFKADKEGLAQLGKAIDQIEN